ncbi:sensor protein [Actinomadura craniellae]|uniref:histidine kinase n=2 Tax=Actinomadura craniellae TaxID=2231787 RepID=A0A365H444_9ACTN|nr:sensor protein [Actinomadura craniellae]
MALILSVPTVLLAGLSILGVADQTRVTRQADAAVAGVELVLATQELIHSLQRERGLTSGLLGGETGYRAQVDAQRRRSDESRAALDRLLARGGSPGAGAVRAALGRLAELGTTRGSVDAGRIARPVMLDFYTAAITALNDAAAGGDLTQPDPELRRGLAALSVLGRAKEATALERGHLNGVFAVGSFTQDDYLRFTEVRATKLDAFAQFSRTATPRRALALESALRTPAAVTAAAYEQRALGGARGERLGLNPPTWWDAMTTVVDDMRTVQRGIGDDVRARAAQIETGATQRLAGYAAAAVLTLVAALLVWLSTFRSIVRPLGALAGEARDAAERRLPAAMERIQAAEDPATVVPDSVRSELARRDDEFAAVTEALDHLRETAVRLAVEQAVMRRNTAESLANLGRRNQNLVRRQLGFITALEREETDPDQLADLFELDHLATRMRRNAESLLVLVGEHGPRRRSGPVAVGDVLRSAFAEVEDYRRVVLRRADDALVQGSAAAEISHLLAELIENALAFSPPELEVEVQARGTGAEYHIAIVDQGVGMTPEAMATANARLRGEQNFLVTPARNLGHYVVGVLAARLGIEVRLHDSPLNGVTARVALPANLLAAPPAKPVPAGSAAHAGTGRRAAPEPGHATAAGRVAVASPPADDLATTRNGLVKRRPGDRALRRPARPAGSPAPNGVERSPGEVRSMLDDLRSGVRRAQQDRPGGPPAYPTESD